jgi:hypothetical protein
MINFNQEPIDRETGLLLLESFCTREKLDRFMDVKIRRPRPYGPDDPTEWPDLVQPFEEGTDQNMRWREYLAGATYALRIVRAVNSATMPKRRVP